MPGDSPAGLRPIWPAQVYDKRTLFVTAELRGNLELLAAGDRSLDPCTIVASARELMQRQANLPEGLSGYFTEAERWMDIARLRSRRTQPWRFSDSGSCARSLATCRLQSWLERQSSHYIEKYLLADCSSNPFSLTPYGVYFDPPHPERQTFRDAGNRRGVRTFIHPFNPQGIVHGTSSVLMSHAHLLARAAALLNQPSWRDAAERLLHWCLGHNTLNRSLFSGIGYRQPVGYSFRIPQLPEAMFVGFIGRPDDSPYLEQSTAIEWNTLEYWSIPFLQAAQAACWLRD